MGRWILATSLLLACAGETRVPPPAAAAAGHAEPVRGGVLRTSIVGDLPSLDPAACFADFCILAEHYLFDTLLSYAPATAADPLALEPQLADRWDVSRDGLVYTFHIRDGARFSDGQPVLAEDFVYQLERVRDPATASAGAGFYAGIAGLRAVEPRTLEIRLARPDASFPYVLAMKYATPQKRAHVEAQGDRLRDHPLGTGPFVLVEWADGERVTLRRDPGYWNAGEIWLDGLEIHLSVPRNVAALKFLRGELDTVENLSSDDHRRFRATPEWQPYLLPSPRMDAYYEVMNTTRPPFHDRRVRQAFNYAISKEDTVRLYGGRAVAASGLLPPLMAGHDPELRPYPHDPARARKLLAEAGYPDGFTVTYGATDDEMVQKIAQSIQADLAQVGVRVRIQSMTNAGWLAALGRGELDFAYMGWLMDFPDPRNFLEPIVHSRSIAPSGSTNAARYSSPEVDRLLDEAAVERDPQRRAGLYRRVERVLYEDCPYVWHYHTVGLEVRQPYVLGYRPHPVWGRDYRRAWLDRGSP